MKNKNGVITNILLKYTSRKMNILQIWKPKNPLLGTSPLSILEGRKHCELI